MALRPKPRQLVGDVPVEMRSQDDPVWQSRTATRRWLDLHGLEWSSRMECGPLNRHEHASQAWALRNDFSQTFSNGFRGVDWRRLREAGVPSGGGAALDEFLRHSGVEVD